MRYKKCLTFSFLVVFQEYRFGRKKLAVSCGGLTGTSGLLAVLPEKHSSLASNNFLGAQEWNNGLGPGLVDGELEEKHPADIEAISGRSIRGDREGERPRI